MSDAVHRPLVVLCECAGTMGNIDFDRLEEAAGHHADVVRDRHWCSREGRARLLELIENDGERRLVFAGCSADFSTRRFRTLHARGLRFEIADIREGCSWVHDSHVQTVTDKAVRIVEAAVAYPLAVTDELAHSHRRNEVLVIGGGVAGTQAAAEIAQMGHRVELVEQRPFLGGRAARIGSVFPTNDCGQCLPTNDQQAGVRKCFHRNQVIDHPELHIWRRTTVESVKGRPGDFEVTLRQLPNIVTDACIDCGTCETVCPVHTGRPGGKAIFTEYYDGRVMRSVDLETCTFCGACAGQCPVDAIDFGQSPVSRTVRVGAILTAVGCEPAPARLIEHLGYGHDHVMTQVELAETMDEWTDQAALGITPARHIVMVQCAGSRDRRRLPYCSRLCCMIALKHAIRLRQLFPRMKVTICYLEMRTAGVGYENWFLAARRAGVEFLRGTPPEVQFDAGGKPVIELEDVTTARLVVLRPDVVVLSAGMVPAATARELAETLGIRLDEDGFVEILDRKHRATETSGEGIFVCGSAAGPKALIEATTEASAVASEIHNFLGSAGRRKTPASTVDPAACIGCDTCLTACPYNAVTLVDRPAGMPRPSAARENGKLAVIDDQTCRACGICAAVCPEVAITHNLSDKALSGRLATLMDGVERPIVCFYCKECAGAALSLSGRHRDRYPSSVCLVELPCIGRVSVLHIIEAVRLGAVGVLLAGCAEGRCQYRSGDASAAEQRRLAEELLAEAGVDVPIEQWHLCAVDRTSVARRLRLFHARATRDTAELAALEQELALLARRQAPTLPQR